MTDDLKFTAGEVRLAVPQLAWCEDWVPPAATENLNRILAEKLKAMPVVYGVPGDNEWGFTETPGDTDTHRAKLVCIEKLEGK